MVKIMVQTLFFNGMIWGYHDFWKHPTSRWWLNQPKLNNTSLIGSSSQSRGENKNMETTKYHLYSSCLFGSLWQGFGPTVDVCSFLQANHTHTWQFANSKEKNRNNNRTTPGRLSSVLRHMLLVIPQAKITLKCKHCYQKGVLGVDTSRK